jgi:cytochrome c-type biogenesis protein CcmE
MELRVGGVHHQRRDPRLVHVRDDSKGSAMKRRWPLIVTLLVAGSAFGILAAGRIGNNLVYYWTASDLLHAGDKAYGASIRLGGMVVAGSLRSESDVYFDVTDGKNIVHVKTHGVPPQMFREGIGVVVEGTMSRAGYFEGTRLMVSHNNEYRAPKGHDDMIKAVKEGK